MINVIEYPNEKVIFTTIKSIGVRVHYSQVLNKLNFSDNKSEAYPDYEKYYKKLRDIGLVDLEINNEGRGKVEWIKLTKDGEKFDSVEVYENHLKIEKEKQEKIRIQQEEKLTLEIRHLKVQIWANEKWYIIAGVSALIGVVLTKLIDSILT